MIKLPTRLLLCYALSLALIAPAHAVVSILFTVNSTADSVDVHPGDGVCADASGKCTLRAAVMEADAHPAADAIHFAASTDGTPIKLTLHGAGEDADATGDLDVIGYDLTITGNGVGKTIIDGDGADRVFDVIQHSLTLAQLTVRNGGGVANGGGIYAQGASSSLTLHHVAVTGNHASSSGFASGGGILADGNFAMSDSSVSGNSAESSGSGADGGGLMLVNANPVAITGSRIANNTITSTGAQAKGAGLELFGTGSVTLQDSVVTGNQAHSDFQSDGGGINVPFSTLTLSGSEVSDNSASSTGNPASFGGGIYAAAKVTLINTTVADNQAQSPGDGGGIVESGSLLTADNATLSGNRADFGGGVEVDSNGTFNLADTLLAGNIASNQFPDCNDGNGSGGTTTSYGYNLISDTTGCSITAVTGDQIGTGASPIDPKLGALTAENGSSTHVLPLLAGSPAIDKADPQTRSQGGTCQNTDQLGTKRPIDGNGDGTAVCDVGAYEAPLQQAAPPSAVNSGGALDPLALLGLLLLGRMRQGRKIRFGRGRRPPAQTS